MPLREQCCIAHAMAPFDLSAALASATPVLKQFVESHRTSAGESTQLKAKGQECTRFLLEKRLATKQRMKPTEVGVCSINRSGVGLDPIDVHALGAKIVGHVGWLWNKVDDPICFEVHNDEEYIFNQKLSASSDGQLADLSKDLQPPRIHVGIRASKQT